MGEHCSALCSVLCALCTVHCALCIVQGAGERVEWASGKGNGGLVSYTDYTDSVESVYWRLV